MTSIRVSLARKSVLPVIAAFTIVAAPRPAAADVDGDCLGELAVARVSSQGWRLMLMDDGTENSHDPFQTITTFESESWPASTTARGLEFGDVDGDGYDELAVFTWCEDSDCIPEATIWRRNQANGAFFTTVRYWNATSNVAFGNLDDDPGLELAYGSHMPDGACTLVAYKLVWNPEQETYERVRWHVWGEADGWDRYDCATAAAFGDVDDDGIDELAVAVARGPEPPGPNTWRLRIYRWTDSWDRGGLPELAWTHGSDWEKRDPRVL
jgi:hypothetical protein